MIEIEPAQTAPALEDARRLVRAHIVAHSTAHDEAAADAIVAALPAPYLAPRGGLWLARLDGAPAGCGALQSLTDEAAEVKRMYVSPACRGHGVARAMAQHLIAQARALGYTRLRLGTLNSMLPAQRLYESLGFRPIPAYRPIEFGDTRFYELSLDVAFVSGHN